jgi:hypothetical protein
VSGDQQHIEKIVEYARRRDIQGEEILQALAALAAERAENRIEDLQYRAAILLKLQALIDAQPGGGGGPP